MEYKIIDNFLSEKEFEYVKSGVMSYDFPWTYSEVVNDNDKSESFTFNRFFNHLFYYYGVEGCTKKLIYFLLLRS
jgi:hypothetical protein